jgi:hypothetical protein
LTFFLVKNLSCSPLSEVSCLRFSEPLGVVLLDTLVHHKEGSNVGVKVSGALSPLLSNIPPSESPSLCVSLSRAISLPLSCPLPSSLSFTQTPLRMTRPGRFLKCFTDGGVCVCVLDQSLMSIVALLSWAVGCRFWLTGRLLPTNPMAGVWGAAWLTIKTFYLVHKL